MVGTKGRGRCYKFIFFLLLLIQLWYNDFDFKCNYVKEERRKGRRIQDKIDLMCKSGDESRKINEKATLKL